MNHVKLAELTKRAVYSIIIIVINRIVGGIAVD